MTSNLTGSEFQKLQMAILDSFSLTELESALAKHGHSRERISLGRTYEEVVFDVISYFQMRVMLPDLMKLLLEDKQDEESLRAVASELRHVVSISYQDLPDLGEALLKIFSPAELSDLLRGFCRQEPLRSNADIASADAGWQGQNSTLAILWQRGKLHDFMQYILRQAALYQNPNITSLHEVAREFGFGSA